MIVTLCVLAYTAIGYALARYLVLDGCPVEWAIVFGATWPCMAVVFPIVAVVIVVDEHFDALAQKGKAKRRVRP